MMVRRTALTGVVLCSLALLPPVAAHGQGICVVDPCLAGGSAITDCDQDGLTDREECTDGISVVGSVFPSCEAQPPPCLDPVVPTVVVLFERVAGGVFDQLGLTSTEVFEFANALPVQIHVIEGTPADLPTVPQPLAITARMAAVHILEDLTPGGGCPVTRPLGVISRPTSANNAPTAKVFSQTIVDYVDCVHDSVAAPVPPAERLGDKVAQLQHTSVHELLHQLFNAVEDVQRYGGRHFRTGSGFLLDQSTTFSTKRKVVTFDIPEVPAGATINALQFGETDGKTICADPNGLDDGFILNDDPAIPAGEDCLPLP